MIIYQIHKYSPLEEQDYIIKSFLSKDAAKLERSKLVGEEQQKSSKVRSALVVQS